ncbi:MAG: helix-turn-helix domain-containing protein [Rubellimicrobium sp.]|nr:helix-turn-helix domain-containing protein [Rubellimicrobium sp.]
MPFSQSAAVNAGYVPSLGERLRDRRKALGLTLRDVAEAAGLTPGFISQIERDLATPSITSLNRVAKVLDLDPAAFLSQPPIPGTATRHGLRPVWGLVPEKMGYERLSSVFPGNVLRAVLIHEAPGHRSIPVEHEGEEMFFILSGGLTVDLDGTAHVLEAGDSLHFPSTKVHSTWNHTTGTTTYFHVSTVDALGDARRTEGHAPGGDLP